ncbi:MAG: MFS transporter [Candidatus Kapaibacteriota bacterium]
MSSQARFAWYMYDWASSAFTTTVITVFLGPYLTSIAQTEATTIGALSVFGIPIAPQSLFPYAVSMSVFLQLLLLPIIGYAADGPLGKKFVIMLCTAIGALATIGMYWIEPGNAMLGAVLFILANGAYGSSIVAYNAMLNDIADIGSRDQVSARGFAIGYAGGGLLLLMNLGLYLLKDSLGISGGHAVRISLASAGIWWGIFTFVPFMRMPHSKPKNSSEGILISISGLKDILHQPRIVLFLIAFLLFNDGIQTVISMAAQFGSEELKLPLETLQVSILLVQIIAIFGALIFGKLANSSSALHMLMLSLILWMCIIIYAYAFLPPGSSIHFYVLSGVIALVLGGSQSMARSIYSKIIPIGSESRYFGIYELTDRGSSWLGPLLFGISLQISGSYRSALLALIIFFLLGIVFLGAFAKKIQGMMINP